jgi:hypothetical protein
MTAYALRVRRGDREVEVQGPSEEWVREMLTELVEEHIPAAGAAVVSAAAGAAVMTAGDGDGRTFRELLIAAPGCTAAEKLLLAAYSLAQQGHLTFGRDDVTRAFEDAMETQVNFHRELKAANQRGWITRASEPNRFRLVSGGVARVRDLTGTAEAA